MKSDFLFIASVTSKKGKVYAVGHLIDPSGKYNLNVTWIESDSKEVESLEPLSVYEVICTGLTNGQYPVWSFA